MNFIPPPPLPYLFRKNKTPTVTSTMASITAKTDSGRKNEIKTPTPKAKTEIPTVLQSDMAFIPSVPFSVFGHRGRGAQCQYMQGIAKKAQKKKRHPVRVLFDGEHAKTKFALMGK